MVEGTSLVQFQNAQSPADWADEGSFSDFSSGQQEKASSPIEFRRVWERSMASILVQSRKALSPINF